MFRIGLDIGSTTAKLVVLDEYDNIVFSKYERHSAKAKETVLSFLKELLPIIGDKEISEWESQKNALSYLCRK